MLDSTINNIRDLQASNKIDKVVKQYGLSKMNANTLAGFCDKTFFILGSGGTINDLSAKQWKEIKSGFSVGMNKWLIHDFIPNAVSMEKGLYPSLFSSLLEDERIDKSRLDFIFYPRISLTELNGFPYSDSSKILNMIRVHSGARYKINDEKSLNKWHGNNDFVKVVEDKLNKGLNVEQKGSVYRLTQFAIGSGFKKIVFCGVDLSNTAYFWEENSSFLKNRGLPPFKIKEQEGNKIHLTEIASPNRLPISTVLRSLVDSTKKQGIEFYTSSEKSKLSEFLPVWMANDE